MTSQTAEGTEAIAKRGEKHAAAAPGYRPHFVAQMTSAAATLGAEITWLSNDYIAAVARGPRMAMIVGYHFPLNNAAASALADDKSGTADILARFDVPHVRHSLIRFDGDGSLVGQINRVAELFGFPLVIKPHRGTSGQGVTRVDSLEAMVAALTCLRVQYQALAASPWVDIEHEYRVIVLADQAQLIFEKVRRAPGGDWRNNLKFGSMAVIEIDPNLCRTLIGMAVGAAGALGLRFASVDLVVSRAGLAVLEVNSGVCLERFSAFSGDHFSRAGAVYVRALRLCLG